MQISKSIAIEPLLHARDALVIDVDQADQMRHFVAGRIDPLVLAQKADSGDAKPGNLLLLLWRKFAFQPDEAFPGGNAFALLGGVEIRQGRSEELDRFVLVDDPA